MSLSSSAVALGRSSSVVVLGRSSGPPNAEGVPGQLHTLRASARLDMTAGDPSDIGLPEHELRPDKPNPRPNPGGAGCIRGDPGVRFRSAFSRSVTGDIWELTPSLAMSNCGMHAGASL